MTKEEAQLALLPLAIVKKYFNSKVRNIEMLVTLSENQYILRDRCRI
jgi:hypothetical protein